MVEARNHIKNGVIRKSIRVGIQNCNRMKKYLILFISIFITTFGYSQSNFQDVIYLKNGSVIHGSIVEQIPNKTIKIESCDNNVFVIQMDEIEKITKEKYARPIIIRRNSSERKGYIGISAGPSVPIRYFADKNNGMAKTGLHVNFLNLGYLFYDYLGITAVCYGGSNSMKSDTLWAGKSNEVVTDTLSPWKYGGIMVGPLISLPLSKTVSWDLRPLMGFTVTQIPDLGEGTESVSSGALGIGTLLRINLSSNFSLMINADYFSSNPLFPTYGIQQSVETISCGLGFNYRLK